MGSKMNFIVRPARSTDAAALTELLNIIIAAGGTTAMEEPLAVDTFAEWFVSGPDVLFCVVAEGDMSRNLLGFQSIYRDAELPERWADIATFSSTRHKVAGVGTRMFAHTRSMAKDLGLTTINATIRADNVQGLSYYDKMGFRTYRTREAVPLRDGTPVDRIMKRYDLTRPN
jgi:L-amino acid N-acyltransferase YncA